MGRMDEAGDPVAARQDTNRQGVLCEYARNCKRQSKYCYGRNSSAHINTEHNRNSHRRICVRYQCLIIACITIYILQFCFRIRILHRKRDCILCSYEIRAESAQASQGCNSCNNYPAYWVMQWAADMRALKREYIDKNGTWEKTEHKGRHFKASEGKQR